jgi:glucokinase
MRDLFVGIDLGGTKTAALVADHEGRALGTATCPTAVAAPHLVMQSVTQAVTMALRVAGANGNAVTALGVGVPGQVDTQSGVVRMAANLNLESFGLADAISAEFNAPTAIENDVRTATIGAYHHILQTQSIQHLVYLSIGTGIAAGVILNGVLHRGANGMAGEIGHVSVDPNGRQCSCGQIGCLETIAAGPGIARQAIPFFGTSVTTQDVFAAASNGNRDAQAIIKRTSTLLARTIQWLIMAYDVEKVVIGGGVANAGAAFLQPILHEFAQLRLHSELTQMMLADNKIMLLPTGFNAGTWGALHLARQAIQPVYQ